jgi:dihydrofolate synthase / folylpolyglutamate synthase
VDEEFTGVTSRILVTGFLRGRDPAEMLTCLGAQKARLVIATAPETPRALPAEQVAAAARVLGLAVETVDRVPDAVSRALQVADEEEMVLVTGSLYVVGAARACLVTELA